MKDSRTTLAAVTAPLVGTGIAMAGYLLLRPYGDQGGDPAQIAAALASPLWIAAHLLGVLALAQFARLALRLDEAIRGRDQRSLPARAARTLGLVGVVLCLPYYGAETFGLHALGVAHRAHPDAGMLAVVDQVRNHPAALVTFGIGLIALSVAAVLVAVVWSKNAATAWAAWPLGIVMALFPVQFYLAAGGRVAYGVVFAICTAIWAVAALRDDRLTRADRVVDLSGKRASTSQIA
ncbi:hypothetical protein IPV09_06355 [Tessaracoccus sp. SD287]|uniref:hypothetical protein n=1 Tax=Tessaracoccus sp. SD287 TaxID=2782008 RepID=UPI001A97792F|nr:hypothetical protein [Tessaracoccus sp. SD287]MBO1030956.1 hypothetical protein [Tessaracoccus sp. SD287]